jgi:hypothetical protein
MRKNKYENLFLFLQNANKKEISLKKDEIERILKFKLPRSSKIRTWWSNNPEDGHSQAYAWIESGYKVYTEGDLIIFRKSDGVL